MTKAINTISKTGYEIFKTKIFNILIFSVVAMVILYVYFLSVTVVQTVARRNNINNLYTLNLEYQKLQESYFSTIENLNVEYAYALGFVDEKNPSFVSKTSAVAKR